MRERERESNNMRGDEGRSERERERNSVRGDEGRRESQRERERENIFV